MAPAAPARRPGEVPLAAALAYLPYEEGGDNRVRSSTEGVNRRCEENDVKPCPGHRQHVFVSEGGRVSRAHRRARPQPIGRRGRRRPAATPRAGPPQAVAQLGASLIAKPVDPAPVDPTIDKFKEGDRHGFAGTSP